MAYVYKIENQVNHKVYIGKTEKVNPQKRWAEHQAEMNQSRSQDRALYKAMRKYGVKNFTFSILEETDSPSEREEFYIQKFNSFHFGYNETLGGDGRPWLELPEQQICREYIAGKTMNELATLYHCDKESISKVLYKNNVRIKNSTDYHGKAVARIDKNTKEILEIFPSANLAEKAYGSKGHIGQVCSGKRKTACGFIWKFVDDLKLID